MALYAAMVSVIRPTQLLCKAIRCSINGYYAIKRTYLLPFISTLFYLYNYSFKF